MYKNEGHSARLRVYFEEYTRLHMSIIRIMLWARYCSLISSRARCFCNSKGRVSWWPLRNLCVASSGPQRTGSPTFDLEKRKSFVICPLHIWSPVGTRTLLNFSDRYQRTSRLGRTSLREARAHLSARRNNCPCCCLLYTSPSPRDQRGSRMPSSA